MGPLDGSSRGAALEFENDLVRIFGAHKGEPVGDVGLVVEGGDRGFPVVGGLRRFNGDERAGRCDEGRAENGAYASHIGQCLLLDGRSKPDFTRAFAGLFQLDQVA